MGFRSIAPALNSNNYCANFADSDFSSLKKLDSDALLQYLTKALLLSSKLFVKSFFHPAVQKPVLLI